jgi:hypothetical protein
LLLIFIFLTLFYLGSTDFLGLNFYSSGLVYPADKDIKNDISYDADKGNGGARDPTWIGYIVIIIIFLES